jgi:hypothetical protein
VPTLDDLRATLHDRAELCDADALDTLVMANRPKRAPRRRLVAPLLAAAAVMVTIGAAAAVGTTLRHDGGTPAASPAPRPAPTWQFTIADVPGWTVSYDFAMWTDGHDGMPGAWGEAATLTPTTGRATLTYGYNPRVEAEYPGNGMGPTSGRGVAVTINGHPGWWAPGRTVDTSSMTATTAADPWAAVASSGDWQPRLVWQNADGSWNDLAGTVGFRPKTYSFDNAVARKAMMHIARTVALTSSGDPVTLPFSVHLGDQYQLAQVSSRSEAACGDWNIEPSDPGGIDLVICRVTADQQYSDHLGLPVGEHVARRNLGDGTVLVVGSFYGSARHELAPAQILDSVDVSPKLDDRSTWLPVG